MGMGQNSSTAGFSPGIQNGYPFSHVYLVPIGLAEAQDAQRPDANDLGGQEGAQKSHVLKAPGG